jgi:hypothetical protein
VNCGEAAGLLRYGRVNSSRLAVASCFCHHRPTPDDFKVLSWAKPMTEDSMTLGLEKA